MCTRGYHEALRQDDAAWSRMTTVPPAGEYQAPPVPGEPPLQLGNCTKCHTTIAREVPQ